MKTSIYALMLTDVSANSHTKTVKFNKTSSNAKSYHVTKHPNQSCCWQKRQFITVVAMEELVRSEHLLKAQLNLLNMGLAGRLTVYLKP